MLHCRCGWECFHSSLGSTETAERSSPNKCALGAPIITVVGKAFRAISHAPQGSIKPEQSSAGARSVGNSSRDGVACRPVNRFADLALLLINRAAHESDVPSPLDCLSSVRVHNRREDVESRTWHNAASSCWDSWPSRRSPQQRPVRAARIDTSARHGLVMGSIGLQRSSQERLGCRIRAWRN